MGLWFTSELLEELCWNWCPDRMGELGSREQLGELGCVEPGFLMGVGSEAGSFFLTGAWLQQRFLDFNIVNNNNKNSNSHKICHLLGTRSVPGSVLSALHAFNPHSSLVVEGILL